MVSSRSADYPTAELAVSALFEDILTLTWQAAYQRHIDSLVVPTAVEMTLSLLACSLEMEFQRKDLGEGREWKEEAEPVPDRADSWVSGHVAVRKVRQAEVSSPWTTLSKESDSSFAYNPPPLLRPQLYPLASAFPQADPELDLLRANKERQILQQKADSERARLARQKKQEERKKMDKVANELKKTDFTYDYEGNIQIVRQRELPEPSVVQFALPVVPEIPLSHPKVSIPTPRRAIPVLKPAPTSEHQFLKALKSTPSMIDLLSLGSGVTAVDSSCRVKRGPEGPGKTMSRAEYKKLVGEKDPCDTERSIFQFSQPINRRRRIFTDIPDSFPSPADQPLYSSLPSLIPAENLSEVDKFNLGLIQAQDWGQNIVTFRLPPPPVPVPDHGTPQGMHAALGNRVRKPRERPFVARKVVLERLAPPRIGRTMGHGMVEPRFRSP